MGERTKLHPKKLKKSHFNSYLPGGKLKHLPFSPPSSCRVLPHASVGSGFPVRQPSWLFYSHSHIRAPRPPYSRRLPSTDCCHLSTTVTVISTPRPPYSGFLPPTAVTCQQQSLSYRHHRLLTAGGSLQPTAVTCNNSHCYYDTTASLQQQAPVLLHFDCCHLSTTVTVIY